MPFCTECGGRLPENAKSCPSCGTVIQATGQAQNDDQVEGPLHREKRVVKSDETAPQYVCFGRHIGAYLVELNWMEKSSLAQLCLTLPLCLIGENLGALAQEQVRYPKNFDAKFVVSRHVTSNSEDPHITWRSDLPKFGFKSDCNWLHIRGASFYHTCSNHKLYTQQGDGVVGQKGTFQASGTVSNGFLSGHFTSTQLGWDQGRPYIDDGPASKSRASGTVKGRIRPDGKITLTYTFEEDITQMIEQVQVEDTGHIRKTGRWISITNNAGQSLSSVSTYRFDPALAQKIDPSITEETIQEAHKTPHTDQTVPEIDLSMQSRKPVTLSGSEDTIALDDALKSQAIGDSQADTPSDQPIDKFDAWKKDFEDRGWLYVEKDGFAEFKPQEGARDDKGWIYSAQKGDFLPPQEPKQDIASIDRSQSDDNDQSAERADPPDPRDGEENERGEVWSDEDGGWIGRNLYEQERERRAHIKQLNEKTNRGQQEDVKDLYDAWQRSKEVGELQPGVLKRVAKVKTELDDRIEKLIGGETDLHRIRFLRDLQDQLGALDVVDKNGVLGDWNRIVTSQEAKSKFQVDYTMKDFIAETGAMTLDAVLTRGAAMATLQTYNAALKEAGNPEGTTSSILWEGVKEGAYQGTVGLVLNKLAVGAVSKAKAARDVAKATKSTVDDVAGATSKIKGNWNSSSEAIRKETQKKLLSKLPANHPARQIGHLNETLGKAGRQFDARKINPHMRLDPNSETYKAGIEALKKDPRYLTSKAKNVTDAVRHDLDLAARERAVKQLYKERPDLKGHLTHFENTGSHARKGLNYREGASDIDFTPKGTATQQGRDAEKLFSHYYDKAVKQVSGGKLTVQDLKAHAYGGDQGAGAFRSETGLKVKDVMNQTSGRIDKLDPNGKITHSLRGDDVVEVGKPTRVFNKGSTARLAKQDVEVFRKDLVNKFREELPEMTSQQERLIQAAKGYKLSRVIEAKAVGGRPLSNNRALYQWSKQIKNRIPSMSDSQMKAMTEKFLTGIEQGR